MSQSEKTAREGHMEPYLDRLSHPSGKWDSIDTPRFHFPQWNQPPKYDPRFFVIPHLVSKWHIDRVEYNKNLYLSRPKDTFSSYDLW